MHPAAEHREKHGPETMKMTIYHNPRCSKSRKTLEIIREHGIEPTIVEYLREPPAATTTLALAKRLRMPVAAMLREKEDEFRRDRNRLDLEDDEALAAWLEQHPKVLERPIVVDEDSGRAVIGRPPENVHELLS